MSRYLGGFISTSRTNRFNVTKCLRYQESSGNLIELFDYQNFLFYFTKVVPQRTLLYFG